MTAVLEVILLLLQKNVTNFSYSINSLQYFYMQFIKAFLKL